VPTPNVDVIGAYFVEILLETSPGRECWSDADLPFIVVDAREHDGYAGRTGDPVKTGFPLRAPASRTFGGEGQEQGVLLFESPDS